jgi:hypothetical protein
MNHDLILKNLAKHIVLDNEETTHFISLLTYKEVPKKTYLLTENQACKNLSYVHCGALHSYCLHKNGKESTIMFAGTDWRLTDMYCFFFSGGSRPEYSLYKKMPAGRTRRSDL